jgi:hypothetical protein
MFIKGLVNPIPALPDIDIVEAADDGQGADPQRL